MELRHAEFLTAFIFTKFLFLEAANTTNYTNTTDAPMLESTLKAEKQEQEQKQQEQESRGKPPEFKLKPEPYNNADYFVVTTPVYWEQAKDYCKAQKSVLTSVMTPDEMVFLRSLTKKYYVDRFWIGGRRRHLNTDDKEFFWMENGKTIENWFWSTEADGCDPKAGPKPNNCPEPNNLRDRPNAGNEDCTEFNNKETKGNDLGCKQITQAFICKRTCQDKLTEYEDYNGNGSAPQILPASLFTHNFFSSPLFLMFLPFLFFCLPYEL